MFILFFGLKKNPKIYFHLQLNTANMMCLPIPDLFVIKDAINVYTCNIILSTIKLGVFSPVNISFAVH